MKNLILCRSDHRIIFNPIHTLFYLDFGALFSGNRATRAIGVTMTHWKFITNCRLCYQSHGLRGWRAWLGAELASRIPSTARTGWRWIIRRRPCRTRSGAADKQVVKRLCEAAAFHGRLPQDAFGFLGEESGTQMPDARVPRAVDPIDGTMASLFNGPYTRQCPSAGQSSPSTGNSVTGVRVRPQPSSRAVPSRPGKAGAMALPVTPVAPQSARRSKRE